MSEDTEAQLRLLTEGFRQALAEAQRNLVVTVQGSAAVGAELKELREKLAENDEQRRILAAEVEQRTEALHAIHRSLSWRLTKPLRAGKTAPRLLLASVKSALARLKQQARKAMTRAVRPAVHWIVRRPRLFMFLRRTIAAHPQIRDLIKSRIVASDGGPTSAGAGRTLTAGAQSVFEDLERALGDASRTSSERNRSRSGLIPRDAL